MKEKIGLFGSSFNPPHNAHIKLIYKALEYFNLSKLIVMPTFIPPHKEIKDFFSPEIRYFMAGISIYYFHPDSLDCFYNSLWNKELWLDFKNFYKKGYREFHREEIILSEYEIRKGGISYTIDTVKYLKNVYNDSDIFIIIGMDEAKILDKWKDYEELLNIAHFVVANRAGFNDEDKKKVLSKFPSLKFFPFEDIDISSTMLRDKIKNKENVSEFLPPVLNLFLKVLT